MTQHTGHNTAVVSVCLMCACIKHHVHGIVTPKTRMGISVDPLNPKSTLCNGCHQNRIMEIDLIGRCVMSYSNKSRVKVTICCACGRATCKFQTIGTYPVCTCCVASVQQQVFNPPKCLCNEPASQNATWMIARTVQNVVIYKPCDHHIESLTTDTLCRVEDLMSVIK